MASRFSWRPQVNSLTLKHSPKLHDAGLRVERKVGDVYVARALVNGRRLPNDAPVAVQNGLVHYGDHVVSISANG